MRETVFISPIGKYLDEFVSMKTVAKKCDVLECGVDDILEFTKD